MRQCLVCGIEPRPHGGTLGAERQRCRQPSTACNAARGNHRHLVTNCINDGGNEWQCGAGPSMAAALSTLRHNDVGAFCDCLARHRDRLDLTDHRNSPRPGSLSMRRRISKR